MGRTGENMGCETVTRNLDNNRQKAGRRKYTAKTKHTGFVCKIFNHNQ